MQAILLRLRDLFCYCGLSKEEYRGIKRQAYISNYQVWKYLHILLLAAYLFLAVALYCYDGLTISTFVQIWMSVYLLVASCLFIHVFPEDSLIAQFAIYFTMIMLLFASIVIAVYQPGANSVTFTVLLVLLPMFMIDKPYFMAILLTSAVIVYLKVLSGVKGTDSLRHETLFAIFYGGFGIIINTFYNFIRVREFTLQKREQAHIEEEKQANEEMARLNTALKQMSESALELLGNVVEERDEDSGEHIQRVKGFSYILADQVRQELPEYGLDDYTVELITLTSVLHDVGKISISDSILCKPGKLTDEEFAIMKTHCEKGCAILAKMEHKWSRDYLDMGMAICRSHHEKWDGGGYPQGLRGDEIPIAAQIVSIADIFDALTTKRVYKDAYSLEEARDMILRGECGAFSDKLLSCFLHCYDRFCAHVNGGYEVELADVNYELISRTNPGDSFVIGLHDGNRTLREKLRLDEEISVMESLSEDFCYICYVNMSTNQVIRFKADDRFTRILDSYGDALPSNERFDKLLNSIIVSDDYDRFRADTERTHATETLLTSGHLTTDFRIRLEDGIHHCRMRLSLDSGYPDAVIVGISRRDEEYELETAYLRMQNELEIARREMENREKLADRLAVIDCISSEYDFVGTLNADTMDVVIYRVEEWFRDMFKNPVDIIVSPEARDAVLKGIIFAEDFDHFQEASRHSAVMQALTEKGSYTVNYRAYKYGVPVRYQTRYEVDRNDPRRIVIGLRCLGEIAPE